MAAYNQCCKCGATCYSWVDEGGVMCFRCWAKNAAREVIASTPQVWGAYDELTRSERDGEGLEGFRLDVVDVAMAAMPRNEKSANFRFKRGFR